MVCIASGTRNHFAGDLGIDRADVLAGLDAFDEAVAYRIDLGRAVDGDRTEHTFVNNVVMGVYGKAVQSPSYRTAKRSTVLEVLQEYAGPQAFDLRFVGPDGRPHAPPDLLFVGNNPYELTNLSGFGCRTRLNSGELGVVSVRIDHPNQLPELAALEVSHRPQLFPGWQEWTTTDLVVDSGAAIEAGVDGEAVKMTAPVRFSSVPGALQVRLARHRLRHRWRHIPSPLGTLARLAGHLPDSLRSD
jgi:diacylglycerol kinase family enzyme